MAMNIKFSKPGYNVLTTGAENLVFDANMATHAILNIVSATKLTANTSVTISHNLGYVPKVWVFMEENDGEVYYRRIPISRFSTFSVDYVITTSDIVISADTTSQSLNFRVIIFTREPTP